MKLQFFIPGIPRPGGSKSAQARYNSDGQPITKNGRVLTFVKESGKHTKEWRASVAHFAKEAWGDRPPLKGPLLLRVDFIRMRPTNHYGSGRNASRLKASAPRWPTTKPDATKLLRALEDALTGILWSDDAQICVQIIRKSYGETPGAKVTVRELREGMAGKTTGEISNEGLFGRHHS